MKTRKLKDLKENERICVEHEGQAKGLRKLFKEQGYTHGVSNEKELDIEFIRTECHYIKVVVKNYYYLSQDFDKDYPASDFIKPKRKNKLKAKVLKIEKKQEYIIDILANMGIGKVNLKFDKNPVHDNIEAKYPVSGLNFNFEPGPPFHKALYKNPVIAESVNEPLFPESNGITELPEKWCVKDNEVVTKWASETFKCDNATFYGDLWLHVEMDGNTFANYEFDKHPIKGYTLISQSDFERLVLNKEQIGNSEQLEAGKWYKSNNAIVCYQGLPDKDQGYPTFKAYGFCGEGEWVGYESPKDVFNGWISTIKWLEASKEEVESALIAEAKKRGFKCGVGWKSLYQGGNNKSSEGNIKVFIGNIDTVVYLDNNSIFLNGKWAEIIQEEETPLPFTQKDHLKFIYHRLAEVHGENKDVDYMLKFKSIINEMK